MKLKPGIFEQLQLIGVNHILLSAPLSPCMITGFNLESTVANPGQPADFELGWGGLNMVSSSQEVKEILLAHGNAPFALEGCGYVSVSANLVDGFEKTKDLGATCKFELTSFIVRLIAGIMHPTPDPKQLIIVQLENQQLDFKHEIIGYQCHIICPVDEGVWMGLYQLHTKELEAATSYYNELKQVTTSKEDIAATLNPNRILN